MKFFALLVGTAAIFATSAFGADRRPDRDKPMHPHRVCVAIDEDGYQYLGFDRAAGDDALAKCFDRSDAPSTCRLSHCIDDVGFRTNFVAE